MGNVLAPPPTAAAPALEADDFLRHMAEMQAHYAGAGATGSGPHAEYRLPAAVLTLAQGAAPHAATAGLPGVAPAPGTVGIVAHPRPLVAEAHMVQVMHALAAPTVGVTVRVATSPVLLATQHVLLDFVGQRRAALAQGLTAVPQGAAADQAARTRHFVEQMDALEARELTAAAARLDAMFRGMIEAGRAHPALRPQILVVTSHAGSFMALMQRDARAALAAARSGIGAAAHAVAAAAAGAAHAAEHWAAGAVSSVGGFFKGLF